MDKNYQVRHACSTREVKRMTTEELRKDFLISDLMVENEAKLVYSHYDRYIVGGIVPVNNKIILKTIDPLKADYFLERRELGIINVGGTGRVTVDNDIYELGYKEALYVGRGKKNISFESNKNDVPAKFYLNSTPAHCPHPTKKITRKEAQIVELGNLETSNARIIYKLIVQNVVKTCQLQMGITELKVGSVWNTMPAHTHDRRMEVYFYFEIPKGQAVSHFMGEPKETRNIWVGNNEAVISPPWSIHSGSGTSNYIFIWGMAGENLDYTDMDAVSIENLR